MPIYSFECVVCHWKEDLLRAVNKRGDLLICPRCFTKMKRVVESFVAETFTPYYDEGLGCDIESKSEKKRVMKELGVVEAGDTVHGGRKFDKHAPHHVGKFELQGVKRAAPLNRDEQVVETVDEKGNTLSQDKWGDLPDG